MRDVVPSYDLYAENRSYADPGFLHAEKIRARARPLGWSIRSHRHAAMWQAMFLTGGGGRALIEGRSITMEPPWFFWIPAGCIHAFDFLPDTEGAVITAAQDLLESALARDGFGAFDFLRTRFVGVRVERPDMAAELGRMADALLGELGLGGFGGRAACAALFDLLLVAAARLAGPPSQPSAPAADLDLYQRFRTLVEASYREQWRLSRYAAALGVSQDRLYAGIRRAAGRSPQEVLHDRVLVEAKRGLLYSTMSVSEIGHALGFDDPAYFTRFFSARAGMAPSHFRETQGA
ncbi:helix-turn-helix domain-containing protein [Terrarubrum flagellatum]|uniref:helix-turn-helix domain-containing protein n=1 Tax=Terrirubrum flagellatum TaxID=2895980 RepID=UPI0031455E2F